MWGFETTKRYFQTTPASQEFSICERSAIQDERWIADLILNKIKTNSIQTLYKACTVTK
jgi:hypothetical protein